MFTFAQNSLSNNVKKDKKKKQYKNKQDSINPTIRVNMAEVGEKKIKKKNANEIT